MIRPHTFIVGASAECDIRLRHPSVSGRHARLEVRGKGWRIVDLGSTNGVSIGGERVQAADVAEGSSIAFGSLPVRLGALLAQANPPQPADGEYWTVGGLPECDVHVDFPRVSAEHARIRNQGGRLWLSGSAANGGTRTEAGPVHGEVQVRLDEPLWLGSLGMSVAEVLWWHDPRRAQARALPAQRNAAPVPEPPPPAPLVQRMAAPLPVAPVPLVVQVAPPSQSDRQEAQRERDSTPPRPVKVTPAPSSLGRNLFALAVLVGFLYFLFPQFRHASVLPSALRETQVMVNETVVLKEGNAKYYTFHLRTDSAVSVEVTASPKSVDVMLMTQEDVASWKEARGNLFGGKYACRQALSAQGVTHMAQSDTLNSGQWTIVVQRPQESALIGDDTSASIRVTVQ